MKLRPEQSLTRSLWQRGELSYKYHAGQELIRKAYDESKNQLFVGECARQFGKTVFEVILACEMAIRKKKAKVKIGTAFHTDLVEFILPAFDMVLEDCPVELRPVWKAQPSKFVFRNGSEIKLVGLDRKPNGLRGTVIDLIILSEAGFISNLHYLFRSVIMPATTHRPECRIVMLSTPPETPAHEFLDYVQKAELEGGYIKLDIYRNPRLSVQTIDRLKRESRPLFWKEGDKESTTWRREYLCEHVTDQDLVIIPEWENKYVQEIKRDEYYPFYHRYVSMDLGVVHDYTACLFGYYDFLKAQLIIEDEFVMRGPQITTDILKHKIAFRETTLWGMNKVYLRVSDNNNPLLLQDLTMNHGFHFIATDKGRLEEMVNTVRILVGKGGLIVHPRCSQLRGCLEYGVWEKKRERFDRSDLYGHYDALAALIYLIRNLNQQTNPIPVDFGFNPNDQILLQRRRESPNAKVLRNAFKLKG